jgi:RecA/RadA recombinase
LSKNFFKSIVDDLKDADLSIAADGESAGEFSGFIDTGSYTLNAVMSADIYGGMPDNKITGFAGETSTGKTFFAMGIAKNFLDANPGAGVMYYDTEAAVNKKMMEERGIDSRRVIIGEPMTVQQFKTKADNFLTKYIETPEKERPKLLMILDSLTQLSTSKEMEDTAEGKDTRDMTRAQLAKAAFRVLTLKCARARVPMIVNAHVYASMGSMYPTNEIAGGTGLKYAASSIAMLSKRKEKDGNEVIGNIIHVKMWKSRLSRENKMVDVLLTYDKGLDRYYGLLDMAERYGVIKKVSTRYEMPDGSKHFGKSIYQEPAKFFTKEILDAINVGVKKEFSYGSSEDATEAEVQQLLTEDAE